MPKKYATKEELSKTEGTPEEPSYLRIFDDGTELELGIVHISDASLVISDWYGMAVRALDELDVAYAKITPLSEQGHQLLALADLHPSFSFLDETEMMQIEEMRSADYRLLSYAR